MYTELNFCSILFIFKPGGSGISKWSLQDPDLILPKDRFRIRLEYKHQDPESGPSMASSIPYCILEVNASSFFSETEMRAAKENRGKNEDIYKVY